MAHIELGADRVGVQMSPLDEVLALHGSLHIPYSHVRSVVFEPVLAAWCRGIRIGTNVPGVKVAGTFFTDEGAIFYDFPAPNRCLTFELDHEHYRRVVVQVDEDKSPAALATEITVRLGR